MSSERLGVNPEGGRGSPGQPGTGWAGHARQRLLLVCDSGKCPSMAVSSHSPCGPGRHGWPRPSVGQA